MTFTIFLYMLTQAHVLLSKAQTCFSPLSAQPAMERVCKAFHLMCPSKVLQAHVGQRVRAEPRCAVGLNCSPHHQWPTRWSHCVA